jgi:protein-S-isoprenylcysteine O-methyltransferase Ste14
VLKILVPLIVGFGLDAASAFTTALSRRLGRSRGELAGFVLRNVLGIPLWVAGLVFASIDPSPPLYAATAAGLAAGWLLLLAGATVQLFAIAVLRTRAARPSLEDELEAGGVYGLVRHPIYAGLLLEFAGMAFVKPKEAMIVAAAIGCAWVVLQARLEERDLLQRMPAYREYMKRVPRFLPRFGRATGR